MDIRSDITLDIVHDVVQVGMGWTNSHLHLFAKGESRRGDETEHYLMQSSIDEGDMPGIPETEVRLDEVLGAVNDQLLYSYDFGDSWDHTLTLESINSVPGDATIAQCIDGALACPPEDCGGVPGYEELREVLADPDHDEYVHLRQWSGDWDPERLVVDEVNDALKAWSDLPDGLNSLADPGYGFPEPVADVLRRVRDGAMLDVLIRAARAAQFAEPVAVDPETIAAMVRPYQWFLDRVGPNGLMLTSAGYLKPADVLACATDLGLDEEWIGKYNRESQTYPVLELRESMQKLGLLRKLHGKLLLTAAGKKVSGSPQALWNHLAAKVPYGDDCTQDAGRIVLLLVAAGEDPEHSRLHQALTALGWRYSTGQAITEYGAFDQARATFALLQRLGATANNMFRPTPAPQPEGGRAFARAALRS